MQWFPGACGDDGKILKYTIYVKAGTNTVSPTNYDYVYFVAPETNYFMTPDIPAGCWSFIIMASNHCGDSAPSQTFNTFECNT
jgi:hypothetical protein